MKATYWRRARQVVQIASLALFVVILVYSTQEARALGYDALLRLDPLAGAAAMLSERRWLARFAPALVVLVAALAFGRHWCGWLCPLGTLIDWASPQASARKPSLASKWRRVKFGLLFVILFSSLWGSLTLLFLDPLTIFVRSMGAAILPALNWLVNEAEVVLYQVRILRGPLDAFEAWARGPLLSYKQPFYAGALLIVGLFGGVLALNRLAPRAWCRYLCPLGALLALVSKASWLKRKVLPTCNQCAACARACPMGTIDARKGFASDSGECILCMDCATVCPQKAITFAGDWRIDAGWGHNPTRRQALGALGISLGALALFKLAPSKHHPHPHNLRPPGAQEKQLLTACIRCGVCVRACPTHGLQPSLIESGAEGFWTPILVPRLGHCDYSCTQCGEVCPTGAIPRLDLATKRQTPLGKAYVNPSLCIPWTGRGDCIVCEEMCPLPEKAIVLQEVPSLAQGGRALLSPVVLHERCIGCGLCEAKCPVNGEAAIRVLVDPMG